MMRRVRRLLAVWVGLAAAAEASAGPPRLHALFADHMVLQAQHEVAVTGVGQPGEQVIVRPSWSEAESLAVAAADGRFAVRVVTPDAGGPHTLTVVGAHGQVVLRDVWIGEVWLASGQSNMSMPIAPARHPFRGVPDHERVIAAARHPRIRWFVEAEAHGAAPLDACSGAWNVCSPETAGACSAVGYFFARALEEQLDVPVGIVLAAHGGSPITAWMSRESLADRPELADELELGRRVAEDPKVLGPLRREQIAAWRRDVDALDDLAGAGARIDCADADWPVLDLPAPIESLPGREAFDGMAWLRRVVTLPPGFAGQDLRLELGAVDDMDATYFNGTAVGATEFPDSANTPRRYRVPGALVVGGANVIAVRALDFWGPGGIHAPHAKLEIRRADGRGGAVSLRGPWRVHVVDAPRRLPRYPDQPPFHALSAAALYHGMIAPLAALRCRGVLFWQGESDVQEARRYRLLLPRLIGDWRALLGAPELPFLYVQLPPHAYPENYPAGELRDAQRRCLDVPHTGMAVTMDLGDLEDLHTRVKQPVGERLARLALKQVYGRDDLVACGPLYAGFTVEGSRVRVRFEHAEGGLVTGEAGPTHFEVAGADGVFHPATARIDGGTVLAWSDAVPEPRAVRYAYGSADQPDLRNAEGLPASTFSSEAWD